MAQLDRIFIISNIPGRKVVAIQISIRSWSTEYQLSEKGAQTKYRVELTESIYPASHGIYV